MPNTLNLQTADDARDIVHRTVQALVEGHLVGLPTETTYAVAAHSLSERGIAKLFEVAPVVSGGQVELSIRSRESAGDYAGPLSGTGRRLIHRCWPGPLSLTLPCPEKLSAVNQLPAAVQQQILGNGRMVSFRSIDHDVVDQIHRYLSAPMVLVSVQTGNDDGVIGTSDLIKRTYGDSLTLLLDDGPTRFGGVTTVVELNGNRWKIVREGVIERAAMNQFVKPVIAVVCTGNTCRSPMAETLLREQLRKRTGCENAVRVISAGVAASYGSCASAQAVEVMGQRGLDLTGHSSRPLDESVMNVADLVLTMTQGHRAAILAAWPEMHDRVFTLRRDGGDISDPVGMAVEVYQQCADQIEQELTKWLDSLGDDFFPGDEASEENGEI